MCDADFLWRYGLGAVKPFDVRPARHVSRGYLRRAATIDELGRSLGLDAERFAATVSGFNAEARLGRDPAFGRGGDAYQRHLGDRDHQPNPCVAPIVRAPFYAIAVEASDLGTAAGLETNDRAQVLDTGGRPIEGLYACGNDAWSIMEGAYPGPGITLGPALTFGYLAARSLAGALPG